MLTRSLVLLVCQFRHFRISHFCYKFYLLLRQLVLYQKLYKLSIAFLNFFYFFCKNYHFYVFLSFLLSIDFKIIYNRKSICNCLFHSNTVTIMLLFTHHYSARCFGMNMPKSRDIQAKIPLPQAIWNEFWYVMSIIYKYL